MKVINGLSRSFKVSCNVELIFLAGQLVEVINGLSRSFMVSCNVELVFLAGQLVKVSQGHKWLVKVIYSKNVLCILPHT